MCFNARAEGFTLFTAVPLSAHGLQTPFVWAINLNEWLCDRSPTGILGRCCLFQNYAAAVEIFSPHFYSVHSHLHWATQHISVCVFSYLPCVFCANQTAGFQETLTELEILALIVGCVCHDLDHRGTNNAFQAKWVYLVFYYCCWKTQRTHTKRTDTHTHCLIQTVYSVFSWMQQSAVIQLRSTKVKGEVDWGLYKTLFNEETNTVNSFSFSGIRFLNHLDAKYSSLIEFIKLNLKTKWKLSANKHLT